VALTLIYQMFAKLLGWLVELVMIPV